MDPKWANLWIVNQSEPILNMKKVQFLSQFRFHVYLRMNSALRSYPIPSRNKSILFMLAIEIWLHENFLKTRNLVLPLWFFIHYIVVRLLISILHNIPVLTSYWILSWMLQKQAVGKSNSPSPHPRKVLTHFQSWLTSKESFECYPNFPKLYS